MDQGVYTCLLSIEYKGATFGGPELERPQIVRRLLFFVDLSHIQGSRTKGCFEVVLEGE